MSYLYRTGNSRNNIAFTNTANSSTRYLRRLGSGRNNVAWNTIPQGSTYNILQRNGTGRNNILWSNLNIPKPVGQPSSSTDITNIKFKASAYGVAIYATTAVRVETFSEFNMPRENAFTLNSKGPTDNTYTHTKADFSAECDVQSNESMWNYQVSCSTSSNSTSIGNLPNAKKLTLWLNNSANYIVCHLALQYQSSNTVRYTISEYKTNIPSGSYAGTYDGTQARAVYNTTW